MARILVWVGLALASAYAVFIGGSWWGIYEPDLRIASVALASVALAAWFVLCLRDPAWRPRSALLPAIAACLASLAISTIFSRFPGISLEYLSYAVLLAGLYLLLVQLLTRDFFRGRFIALSGTLLVATVVAYLGLNVSHWVHWLEVVGHAAVPPLRPEFESLTLGNPSAVLTLVALLAVPVVGTASWRVRSGIAVVAIVLGLVAVVALVSASRAGWLALGIAGLVAIAGAAASREGRAGIRGGIGRLAATTAGRAALITSIALAALALAAVVPLIAKRAADGGEAHRLAFIRIALELFVQSPVVGTGPGSWVIQRPGLTLPTEPDQYIPHAHNLYAQTLGELGLVGALAGIVLVMLVLRLLIGATRSTDTSRRRLGWAVLIGLVYFTAHQLLDFYANFPSVLFAAALPVALVDAAALRVAAPGPARFKRLELAQLGVGAGVLVVSLALLGAQELPALEESRAVERANEGEWTAADAPARSAAAADPRVASYLFTAGLTAAHAGDHRAAAQYFREVTLHNDLPEAWLNLAAEQAELGDLPGTVTSLEAAYRLGYQRPAVAVPLGDLALRIGEGDLALDALAASTVFAPSFLADPWWTRDPTRSTIRVQVAQAAARAGGTEWQIALMMGDAARARTLAADPSLDPSTIDFINAWTGDEAAYERLSARCKADPTQVHVLAWCARIEQRRGNSDRADDLRFLANVQLDGDYGEGAELRVATRPVAGRTLEGSPAIFWGTYTYRRPTPWDILVPSLAHLTLE